MNIFFREEEGITRQDFLDSLVALKRKNDAENSSPKNDDHDNISKSLSYCLLLIAST